MNPLADHFQMVDYSLVVTILVYKVRHSSYILTIMSIDYLQMLRQLLAERESWQQKRNEADRQIASPRCFDSSDCEDAVTRTAHGG